MIEKSKQSNQENVNINSFLLGVLLGTACSVLITTKKGREILKIFIDEGMKKFRELELYNKDEAISDIDDDLIDDSDYSSKVNLVQPISQEEPEPVVRDHDFLLHDHDYEDSAKHVTNKKEDRSPKESKKKDEKADLDNTEVNHSSNKINKFSRRFFKGVSKKRNL